MSNFIFAHTLPEAFDIDCFMKHIEENYKDQVKFMRIIKRISLHSAKEEDGRAAEKHSSGEV